MPAMKEMAATSAIPVPVRLALMILRRLCLVMESSIWKNGGLRAGPCYPMSRMPDGVFAIFLEAFGSFYFV
ncbi:hypothetical protein L905_02390 [Agrobacterium sp. TS43]|nr:hypothetical protein L903_04450 [Agrobacterium sp. JL28]KVK52799.1 hypothetical protein L904_00465 [Agrobacterium sp. LY4]KVK64947.1 hypothetical protein L906_04415 [Agrobacterium sp. TS45]KVK69535.1 hypothetical protein L905_02390 [Agrobacterium sp. TS43]